MKPLHADCLKQIRFNLLMYKVPQILWLSFKKVLNFPDNLTLHCNINLSLD